MALRPKPYGYKRRRGALVQHRGANYKRNRATYRQYRPRVVLRRHPIVEGLSNTRAYIGCVVVLFALGFIVAALLNR